MTRHSESQDQALDHHHDGSFPSALRTIYAQLQHHHSTTRTAIPVQHSGLNVLGIPTSLKRTFDPVSFRNSIARLLSLPPGTTFPILQVVGDSGTRFTDRGLSRTYDVLMDHVGSRTVLEYGYTAGLHDANWAVNEFIARNEDVGLRGRTLGNLVFKSSVAVEEWGCEATDLVRNYVLLFDGERQTGFGEDVWVSDFVMDGGQGDVMICLEGGVQALEQVVNAVFRGVRVVAVTGTGMREENDGKGRRFSAAALLAVLVETRREGNMKIEVGRYLEPLRHGQFEKKDDVLCKIEGLVDRLVDDEASLDQVEIMRVE